MRDRALRLAALLLLLAAPLAAQARAAKEKPLLDRLVGDWRMTGTVQGEPVTYTMSARRVLQGKFVELRLQDAARPPQYEARVFIGTDSTGRVIAHWMDVFGPAWSVPHGEGTIRGDTLQFTFQYANGPFRDTFTFDRATGRWRFLLESSEGAARWTTFADYDVRRTPGGYRP